MASSNMLSDLNVFDAELDESSSYEDARDASDDELRRLYASTAQQLQLAKASYSNRDLRRVGAARGVRRSDHASVSAIATPSSPKVASKESSSSNDGSSIERISSQPRSRHSTGRRRRVAASAGSVINSGNVHRSDGSSNSNGEGWKVINPMDNACYSLLLKLELQVELLAQQLSDMQIHNSLHLKLTYRLLKTYLSSKRRSWFSGAPYTVWLLLVLWPICIQVFYWAYKTRRPASLFALLNALSQFYTPIQR